MSDKKWELISLSSVLGNLYHTKNNCLSLIDQCKKGKGKYVSIKELHKGFYRDFGGNKDYNFCNQNLEYVMLLVSIAMPVTHMLAKADEPYTTQKELPLWYEKIITHNPSLSGVKYFDFLVILSDCIQSGAVEYTQDLQWFKFDTIEIEHFLVEKIRKELAEFAIKENFSFDNYLAKENQELKRKNEELDNLKTELLRKNKQLELEVQQKELLQNRMQKLVEQFTHSLGNVIFPDTIYQVAERLKKIPECRSDTLLLHEAYHAEIIIKLQSELLRQRYGNSNPEKFRVMIRQCRRNSNSGDKTKSIEDIVDYAISRVTARFLNVHYAGLETIRNKILSQTNTDLNQLKQKFEDDIFLHNCSSPIEWVSKNLRPIQIMQISPLWKKVFTLADSYTEALLFGYFSEILFNAFKYADHENKEFLTLSFAEENINDGIYLSCSWSNPTTNKKITGLGNNQGLEAIEEDLKQLNNTENREESLLISQQSNQFKVTLLFKKELLVNELAPLKIKRQVSLVE